MRPRRSSSGERKPREELAEFCRNARGTADSLRGFRDETTAMPVWGLLASLNSASRSCHSIRLARSLFLSITQQRVGGDTPVAVAAVVCGCLHWWVLPSVYSRVSSGCWCWCWQWWWWFKFQPRARVHLREPLYGSSAFSPTGKLYERSRSTNANSSHLRLRYPFSRPSTRVYPIC